MLPLVFERFLRPGSYTLILKLEDLNGGGFFRDESELEVPAVEGPVPPPPVDARSRQHPRRGQRRALDARQHHPARAAARRAAGRPGALRHPDHRHRHLRGALLARRPADPAQEHARPTRSSSTSARCRAPARCAPAPSTTQGAELAWDEMLINASATASACGSSSRAAAQHYEKSLRAEAEVEMPEDGDPRARRVLPQRDPGGDALPGALHAADRAARRTAASPTCAPSPTRSTATRPRTSSSSTRRTTSRSSTSSSSSSTPRCSTARTTRSRDLDAERLPRPRGRRAAGDRALRAGREPADPRRRPARRLGLDGAQPGAGARRPRSSFFESAITPKDRARADHLQRPPDARGQVHQPDSPTLAGGLAGLKAERGTSLYDSVVFSLFYFNGVKGQRALLLLSDGKDESSRFDVRGDARLRPPGRRRDLHRRPRHSAHRARSAQGPEEARRGDRRPRLLHQGGDRARGRSTTRSSRSCARATCSPTSRPTRAAEQRFRIVDLKVGRSGLEAKTIRGYYP